MKPGRRTALATLILVVAFMTSHGLAQGGPPAAGAGQSLSIGVLPFQDASGGDYGDSLAKVLARQFQAALLNASRHTPRVLKTDSSGGEPIDVASAIELARAQKVDFAVVGSLLSAEVTEGERGVRAPSFGGIHTGGRARSQSAEVVLQVELINVEQGERVASLRVTGKERDTKIGADLSTRYGSMDMGDAAFQDTVLGKATQKAVDQAVKQMLPRLKK